MPSQRPPPLSEAYLATDTSNLTPDAAMVIKNTFWEAPCGDAVEKAMYAAGMSSAPAALQKHGTIQGSLLMALNEGDEKNTPPTPSTAFESSPTRPPSEHLWPITPVSPAFKAMSPSNGYWPTTPVSPAYHAYPARHVAAPRVSPQLRNGATPEKYNALGATRTMWADIPAEVETPKAQLPPKGQSAPLLGTADHGRAPVAHPVFNGLQQRTIPPPPLQPPTLPMSFPQQAPTAVPVAHLPVARCQVFQCVANAPAPKFAPPGAPAPCGNALNSPTLAVGGKPCPR